MIRYNILSLALIAMVVLLSSASAAPTDTIYLSTADANNRFVQSNLLVLAQQYNVDAAKAQVIQSKLIANPVISLEQNIYNQYTKELLPMGKSGQNAVNVQQLILLAGKRNKSIRIAQANADVAGYAFYDLLRTLNYSSNSNFFELYFQFQTLNMYSEQIVTVSRLADAYRQLFEDNNAALKDVLRLESFLLSLTTDKNTLELAIAQNQTDLRLLLGISTNSYIIPVINQDSLDRIDPMQQPLDSLIRIAQENRYDLKQQQANVKLAELNLALQKAQRVPDITAGYLYDRAGSYIINYNAVTLQFSLPVFNLNRGGIKAARYAIEASTKQMEQTYLVVNNDVITAYNQAYKTEDMLKNLNKKFVSDYTALLKGAVESYRKGNMSQIELMDYFESYRENITQVNTLKNNRLQNINNINFAVGKSIFKL